MEFLTCTVELRPMLYRIPEHYRQEERSVSLVETGPLFGLSVPRETDLLLELGILDDLVQSRSNLRVQHLEIYKILSRNGSRRLQYLQ